MPSDSEPLPRKYLSLDVFRGVCALAVFFSHLYVWSFFQPLTGLGQIIHASFALGVRTLDWLTWHTGGQHPAVIGFLVLSGFCIHLGGLRRHDAAKGDRMHWWDYLRRRLVRILPVYWCGSALGWIFAHTQTVAPAPDPTLALNATYAPWDLVIRLSALSVTYPYEILVGNSILNYISAELCLYLGYPALFLLHRRMSWASLFILSLGIQIIAYLLAPVTTPYWAYNTPLMFGPFFVLGAAAAERWRDNKPLPGARVALVLWMLFLATRMGPAFEARNLVLQLLWAGVCVGLIGWLLEREKSRPAFGAHPLVRRLVIVGRGSFSLYAVHSPVLFLSAWLLYRHAPQPSYELQLAISLGGSLLLTALVYRFVERRCIRGGAQA